jgi:hypothetical protein
MSPPKEVRVPAYTVKTVQVGQSRVQLRTEHSAPQNPPPAISYSDIGKGAQITRLLGNGRDWRFAEATPWRVKLYDKTGKLLSGSIDAAYFPTQVITPVGSGFQTVWTKGGETTTVTAQVAFDSATGETRFGLLGSLDPVAFPNVASWSFVRRFVVEPYVTDRKADMMSSLCAWGSGIVYRNATALLNPEPTIDIPGFNGTPIFPQIEGGGSGSAQLMSVWDPTTRSCLAVRTMSNADRLIRYTLNGDGNHIVLEIEEFPEDHLNATSFASSFDVEMVGMEGDWWDASQWYLGRAAADARPWMARGTIDTMTGLPNEISQVWLDADVVIVMAPGNAFAPSLSTNDPAIWQRCRDEIIGIRNSHGTDLKYLVLWYTINGQGNDSWIDYFPVHSNALTAVAAIAALPGVTCSAYIISTFMDPTSAFAAAHPAYVTNLILTESQARLTTGIFQTSHDVVDIGAAAMRLLLFNHWKTMTAQVPGIRGAYWDDDEGTGLYENHDIALAASQRGPGAARYIPGNDAFHASMNAEFKTAQGIAQWVTMGEFFTEQKIPSFDSGGAFVLTLPDLSIYVPIMQALYGDRMGVFSFTQELVAFNQFSIDDWDLILWGVERQWHWGSKIGYGWNGFTNLLKLVATAADNHPDFASIYPIYQEPAFQFTRKLARSLRDKNVRDYHHGKLLRALPGSSDDRLLQNGLVSEVAFEPVFDGGVPGVIVKNQRIQSSVRYSPKAGQGVAILLTNHHKTDESFRIQMTPERYHQMVGKKYLWRQTGSGRAFVRHVPSFLDLEWPVLPGEVEVLELLSLAP